MSNPFRYFNSSPEVIRLVVMMYVRYPLSLRNVEDLLAERGIHVSHETVRFWWNRFGPMFAAEIRKRRAAHVRGFIQWRWLTMVRPFGEPVARKRSMSAWINSIGAPEPPNPPITTTAASEMSATASVNDPTRLSIGSP